MRARASAPTPYPAKFPLPLQSGYSVAQTHGVAETQFSNGWIRRRRISPWTYRSGTLSFKISVDIFAEWHEWAHAYAFKWLEMDLQDDQGLPSSEPYLAKRIVRFSGAVNFEYGDWDFVRVSVPCEFLITSVEP